jgi:hypothetical protein
MSDDLQNALAAALTQLDKWNEQFLRPYHDDAVGKPLAYSEVVIRVPLPAGRFGYRKLLGVAGGAGSMVAHDGSFPPAKQAKLIRELNFRGLATSAASSFRLTDQSQSFRDFDSLQAGGVFVPSEADQTPDSVGASCEDVIDRYRRHYNGKSGLKVGEAINLISYALFVGKHALLDEGQELRTFLIALVSDNGKIELPQIAPLGPSVEFSASLMDFQDPIAPPLAKIYTIVREESPTCLLTDDAKAALEAYAVAAAQSASIAAMVSKVDQKDSWSWASKPGLARQLLTAAMEDLRKTSPEHWSAKARRHWRETNEKAAPPLGVDGFVAETLREFALKLAGESHVALENALIGLFGRPKHQIQSVEFYDDIWKRDPLRKKEKAAQKGSR